MCDCAHKFHVGDFVLYLYLSIDSEFYTKETRLELKCTHLLQRTSCHFRCGVNYARCHVFRVFCFQCGFVNCIGGIEASYVCSDGWLCRCIRLLFQRWWIRLTWRRIRLINRRTWQGVCGRMWISWCWRWRTVRFRWTILFNWNFFLLIY